MATNTFKRATAESISENSSLPTTLYTCPASVTSILIGILLCNKLSSEVTASVYIETTIATDDNAFVVKDLVIPANTSTELVLGKIVMTHNNVNGDVLKAYCNTLNAVDATVTILEDVN